MNVSRDKRGIPLRKVSSVIIQAHNNWFAFVNNPTEVMLPKPVRAYVDSLEFRQRQGIFRQMSKGNATLLDRELSAVVRSGIFRSETEARQEALGCFFASNPDYRIEAALEMLRSGEVTFSRAAEIAGLNSLRFRELWRRRGGRQVVEVDAKDVDAQVRRIARLRS